MDGGRGRPPNFPHEYGGRGRGRSYEQQGLPEHNVMFPPGMGGVSSASLYDEGSIDLLQLTYPFDTRDY